MSTRWLIESAQQCFVSGMGVAALCLRHGRSGAADDDIVYVDTEREFEWVAEIESADPAAHAVFDTFCQNVGIEISVDIEATKIRKRWMMNGTQLALVILAASAGFRNKYMADYCDQFPHSLEALIGDLRTACEWSGKTYSYGELDRAESWYKERLIASMRSGADGKGDSVQRMLSKAKRESAGDMLRDVTSQTRSAILTQYFRCACRRELRTC